MHNGFDALQLHANRLRGVTIPDLLAAELKRPEQYARQVGPLYFNFARQKYDCVALEALFALARNHNVTGAFQRMFCGEQVNVTEGRAVLHTALRGDLSGTSVAVAAYTAAAKVRERMYALIAGLDASEVTDIVSVGIGAWILGHV